MAPVEWSEEMLGFCRQLTNDQIQKLPFQKSVFQGFENRLLIDQAICYQKAASKFPMWWATGKVVFPDKIAVEQASSEWTAQWKAQKFAFPEMQLADVCAGLGVDAFWFGKFASQILLFETNEHRAQCLIENGRRLDCQNWIVYSHSFLDFEASHPDLISENTLVYADPDRRVNNHRDADWRESSPSLPAIYERVKLAGARLLVKLSPLDRVEGLLENLPGAESVWVVSLHNEVKEMLVFWNMQQTTVQPAFYAVEINRKGKSQTVLLPEKQGIMMEKMPESGGFLLDPWAAMRKDFRSTGWMQQQGFSLLSEKAQFFYASKSPTNFTGRIFQIKEVIADWKGFANRFKEKPMQVLLRNFPANAEGVKKKFRFSESETQFLVGFQNAAGKNVFLWAEKQI